MGKPRRKERGYHSDTAEDNLTGAPLPVPRSRVSRGGKPLNHGAHIHTMAVATCHPESGRMCKTLEDRLGPFHGRGLSIIPIINIETGEQRHHYVGYRKSAKDRPLVLNFCPWCRADIRQGINLKAK